MSAATLALTKSGARQCRRLKKRSKANCCKKAPHCCGAFEFLSDWARLLPGSSLVLLIPGQERRSELGGGAAVASAFAAFALAARATVAAAARSAIAVAAASAAATAAAFTARATITAAAVAVAAVASRSTVAAFTRFARRTGV